MKSFKIAWVRLAIEAVFTGFPLCSLGPCKRIWHVLLSILEIEAVKTHLLISVIIFIERSLTFSCAKQLCVVNYSNISLLLLLFSHPIQRRLLWSVWVIYLLCNTIYTYCGCQSVSKWRKKLQICELYLLDKDRWYINGAFATWRLPFIYEFAFSSKRNRVW